MKQKRFNWRNCGTLKSRDRNFKLYSHISSLTVCKQDEGQKDKLFFDKTQNSLLCFAAKSAEFQ